MCVRVVAVIIMNVIMCVLMGVRLFVVVETTDELNSPCVRLTQRFKDINEVREMVGPALLQQLDASIQLRDKPQHVAL
jgi:hypothetical protein